ncbi:hypothetical protein VPH35_096785 [Triticum aestivum]
MLEHYRAVGASPALQRSITGAASKHHWCCVGASLGRRSIAGAATKYHRCCVGALPGCRSIAGASVEHHQCVKGWSWQRRCRNSQPGAAPEVVHGELVGVFL